MIYDSAPIGVSDGQWHCPFSRRWVERMKRAAKACKNLSDEYVTGALNREVAYYRLPPGEFLSEVQDARGLPLSWCDKEDRRFSTYPTCCTSIYDYDSIPEVVLTNGVYDWNLKLPTKVLTA